MKQNNDHTTETISKESIEKAYNEFGKIYSKYNKRIGNMTSILVTINKGVESVVKDEKTKLATDLP